MTANEVPSSPVPWQTFPEMILANCGKFAALEAVADGDVRLTFAELGTRGQSIAAGLRGRGFGPGDRVAMWGPNGWQWIVGAVGVWLAGGILVPLSTRFKGIEAAEVLRRAEVNALLTYTRFLDNEYVLMLEKELGPGTNSHPFGDLDALRTVVLLDDAEHPHFPKLSDLEAEGQQAPLSGPVERAGDDVCEILFTSGTTGRSKGVLQCHRQLLECFWNFGDGAGMRPGDRYLAVLPFGFGGGLNGCLTTSLIHGVTVVPLPVFGPAETLDLVRREKITTLLGPPQLFLLTIDFSPDAHATLGTLRTAMTGAAAVPSTLMARLKHEVGVERVINSYGLIEACTVTMTRADDPDDVVTNTCGRPLPGFEVRIVAPDGSEVPNGERGEIVVQGPGVMKGYLDAGLLQPAVDDDGWLHTGDIGERDDAGCLRVVDRLKDMIIVGGFNAYPAEIENIILRRPDVVAVAVVGIPDERLGEVPCAVLVPADRDSFDSQDFHCWLRESMSNFKVPRKVILADALPTNASGKVDKLRLRADVAEDR